MKHPNLLPPPNQKNPKMLFDYILQFFSAPFFSSNIFQNHFIWKKAVNPTAKQRGGIMHQAPNSSPPPCGVLWTRLLSGSSRGNPSQQPCSRRIKRRNSFCAKAGTGWPILRYFKRWWKQNIFSSPIQQIQQPRRWWRYARDGRSSTYSYPSLTTGHHRRTVHYTSVSKSYFIPYNNSLGCTRGKTRLLKCPFRPSSPAEITKEIG